MGEVTPEEPTQPLTESGEIRMHRIPELQAAVQDIRSDFTKSKTEVHLHIQTLGKQIDTTSRQIDATALVMQKIGERLYALNWAMSILGIVSFMVGVISFLSIFQHIHDNRQMIERLQLQERAEQAREDERNVREDIRNTKAP